MSLTCFTAARDTIYEQSKGTLTHSTQTQLKQTNVKESALKFICKPMLGAMIITYCGIFNIIYSCVSTTPNIYTKWAV